MNSFEKLPEMCYSTNQMTGALIVIKRGESGYCPCDWSTPDDEKNRSLADHLNKQLGVTKAQEQAMFVGSMFSWNCSGADPDTYAEEC